MLRELLFLTLSIAAVHATKMYSGQRIFNDVHMIDFTDPAKHGFHIILDQSFVDVHLQPTKLPTVFATAIPLKRPQWKERHSNQSAQPRIETKPVATTIASVKSAAATRRVTKVLYPENGGPEDGLLDGRTIKLLGLQERSWYYVCVEFESNLNRHEMATGLTCQLKRTLDKFGKTAESVVSEVELLEATDRSITVQLVVEVDFPLSLTVFLDQSATSPDSSIVNSVPAQTFIVDRSRTLNVVFGSFLEPATSYGRLCIIEEPILGSSEVYTAMGRAVKATLEHCYFDDMKTKPAQPRAGKKEYQEHFHMAEEPSRGRMRSDAAQYCGKVVILMVTVFCVFIVGF